MLVLSQDNSSLYRRYLLCVCRKGCLGLCFIQAMPCAGETQTLAPYLSFLSAAGHPASGPVQVCQEVSSGADRREQIPGKAEGSERCPSSTSAPQGGYPWAACSPRGAQHGESPGPGPRDPQGPHPMAHHVPGRQRCLSPVCPALCPAPGRAPRRELQESIKVALFWGGQHEVLHSLPPPAALEVLLVDECTLRPCFS